MKKKFLALLLALVLSLTAFIAAGCDEYGNPLPDTLEKISKASSKADLGIKYAKNMSIDYLGGSIKLITDSDGNKLMLVPKGTAAPAGYDDAVLIETPITSAMYNSTTYVGLLGALGVESAYDSVTAVTFFFNDTATPEILARFKNGTTKYIEHGYAQVGDIEEIIKTKPDIVFTGGMDDAEMQLRNLLDEVGIKHVTMLEWTEEGDSAYLEWIKFFGAFFNLDAEAEFVFEAKMSRLADLKEKAAGVTDRPTVAYGMIWDGTVYTQASSSTLAQSIASAGGSYVPADLEAPDGGGSVTIGMEEFLDKCRDADIVIYGSLPQYCPDKPFLLETEPLMAEFKAFKDDNIYIFDKGYYMNSAKAVEKFEDLVFMFHPDLVPGHELVMYQKLPD
jgi:iron complex transport system substrate-binding protein